MKFPFRPERYHPSTEDERGYTEVLRNINRERQWRKRKKKYVSMLLKQQAA